jgi:hypothetical protein
MHAPGHVSEDFRDLIEEHNILRTGLRLKDDDGLRPFISALWNCHDIMPQSLCLSLDLPQGSSYAQGVRSLHFLSRT